MSFFNQSLISGVLNMMMSGVFAELPKPAQEQILFYLQADNFPAAKKIYINCVQKMTASEAAPSGKERADYECHPGIGGRDDTRFS